MARRGGGDSGSLFIGRLSRNTRVRDVEEIFESYGRMTRCDIKYGADMAFAFVDYEDRRDAEDALRYENGRTICGANIIVEWAKGAPRVPGRGDPNDECFKCRRPGHMARDCPGDRGNARGAPPRGRFRESRSRSRSPRDRRRWSRSPRDRFR